MQPVRSSLLFLILIAGSAYAELIPPSYLPPRTIGTHVGVTGGIPNRTTIITATGLDPTGVEDNTDEIQAQINTCPANAVLLLPAGTYKITAPGLELQGNTTLRGAGMDVTTIALHGTGAAYALGRREETNGFYAMDLQVLVTTPLPKGATSLTIASGSDMGEFTVGSIMQVARTMGGDPSEQSRDSTRHRHEWTSWVVCLGLQAEDEDYLQDRQHAYLLAANHQRHDPGHDVRAICSDTIGYGRIGVENLTVDLYPGTTPVGVYYAELLDCWITNVKVKGSTNYSILIGGCLFTTVHGCWMDDLQHSGSNGAGLLVGASTGLLVENCVIRNSFPGMEINGGTCGSIFAYNFLKNDDGNAGIDMNHEPHNHGNIVEGNATTSYMSDGYFGSEDTTTVFRNWITGIDTYSAEEDFKIGYIAALKRFTRRTTFIGNIFGVSGYTMYAGYISMGQPNLGNPFWDGEAPPGRIGEAGSPAP